MTRFQLVFRRDGEESTEIRDSADDGEPHIDGVLIVDGRTYMIKGADWLLTADHIGDTKRFICTLVAQPVEE